MTKAKKAFHYLAGMVIMTLIAPVCLWSCSEDEPIENGFFHPQLGWLSQGASTTEVVGVESEANHQHGQDHRSSNNFNTSNLPVGDFFYWELDSAAQADGVSFRVMKDNPGKDDVIEEYVTHGSLTQVYRSSKLYIADPKKAKKKFSVTVSCVKGDEGSIYVTSAKDHQQGQKHRASSNFNFKHALYEVVLPNDNISFCICNDVSGGTDSYIYRDLKNGQIINQSVDYNLYLADVTGADGPFTLQLKPVTRAWMTSLPDNTLLTELSMPGTHDAGTYNCNDGMAKCQHFSIRGQLEFGIRVFDIRFDSEMDIRHGIADCGIRLDNVLGQMNSFLDENPRECILMILNQHADNDYPNLPKFFEENPKEVSRVDRDILSFPTLGEARGKILMLRRFPKPEKSGQWGIDMTDWPDDGAKGVEYTLPTGEKVKYYIQDRYFSPDEAIHDTYEKHEKVYETMEKSADGEKDRLYINYNSVAGRMSHHPWDYAWGASVLPIDPIMMYSLKDNIKKIRDQYPNSSCRLGVVMLDFYNRRGNDDSCRNTEAIINCNFAEPIY